MPELPQPQVQGELPMPRPVSPFSPSQLRLPLLGRRVIGTTPKATPPTVAKFNHFVQEFIDPELTLDLVSGRTRLMVLRAAPKRVQVADENVAGYTILTPKQISLQGRHVGTTVLTLWFPDAKDPALEVPLTYQVRVSPDPEAKERLERRPTRRSPTRSTTPSPNSNVCLQLVGDKLVVTGSAHDIAEATRSCALCGPTRRATAAASADGPRRRPDPGGPPAPGPAAEPAGAENVVPPGLEEYEIPASCEVINLLRIQGEQQVMLRVTVAEVNRTAARSIGLNFSVRNNAACQVFANNTGSIASAA